MMQRKSGKEHMKSTEQPERGTEKLKTKTNTTKLQETEAGLGMPSITFQTVSHWPG